MIKLDIALMVPGLQFNGDALINQSLGGSETAGLCMAKELRARGHNVFMFCNTTTPGKIYDGVVYLRYEDWEKFASSTIHDISIVQRVPSLFKQKLLSRLNVLWCHDLALSRQYQEVRGVMWNVDGIFTLSKFMSDQYKDVYNIPDKYIWQTRNGLNLDLFPVDNAGPRDRKKLVYSARPERGLDVLLDKIVPILFNEDPEYKLYIYGYDNPTETFGEFYGQIADKCRPWGDRIIYGGQLSKPDLYRAYSTAGIYVYPTPSKVMPKFAEISCISVMEAQAAGMPVVCSDRGALPETLHYRAGFLVKGDPISDEYVNKFCNNVRKLVSDDQLYDSMSNAGREHTHQLSWGKVAEEWENKLLETLDRNNDNPVRLARHFIRRSDIYAAEKVINNNPEFEGIDVVREYIDAHYPWRNSDVAIREHYIRGGMETDVRLTDKDDPVNLFHNSNEARFHYIERVIKNNNVNKVLDYGCGHGWCDIYLHNKTKCEFVGVDIDPNAVKWSRNYADRHADDPKKLDFYGGTVTDLDLIQRLSHHAPFDCLILSDVLEHVRNPIATVNALLPLVAMGGVVVITTPYGPSEYGTYNWDKFRNHLWEFDPHDLEEMFGNQDQYDLHASPEKINIHTGDMVGFHAMTFLRSNKRIENINWQRKLRLQRPTQTLSVSVMAGGPFVEETAHWMMRSVISIANEVVVADCGMSDEAKRIFAQYPVKMVEGKNPLEHGFHAGRNSSLEHCTMDWVLWIDCDEKLVDFFNMTKYLRDSLYDGFSVRQHHFTVDAVFNPDMPTRLFRRVISGPDQIKFYGFIHEHPERKINTGVGEIIVVADAHIAHVGYLSESGRKQRFWRNNPLLQRDIEAFPDRMLQKHFIMRDNMLKCTFELQQNGGHITDEMRARAEETKKIFREHFLGKPAHLNSDSLQYYSQALELLGEGFEMTFNIAARRDNIGDQLNGGTRARFADYEEARREIEWRIKDKVAPFEKEYW